MKTKCLGTVVLFFLSACARTQPAQMTLPEQEAAKEEIGQAINGIFESLERTDTEGLFQSYSASPDFILFTTDGSLVNYQEAKDHHVEWFKSLSSLKVTTVNKDFVYLPDNTVICAWVGTFAMTLKTGQEPTLDFGITFVFSKIDNHWKVIYQQTSALPQVQQNQGE